MYHQEPRWKSILWGVLILLVTGIWVFPVLWMLITSLKPSKIVVSDIPYIVFRPTLKNYAHLFEQGFSKNLINSLLVSTGGTLIALALGSMAAYALARFRLRVAESLAMWFLSLRMVPAIVTVVPFYMLFYRLRLLDTYPGLLIVNLSFSLPFSIWMLQGFFSEIPPVLDDAASIDGASKLQFLFYVVLPLARGGIAVTAIFIYAFSWNEFVFAFMLTQQKWATIPVVIGASVTPFQILWGQLTAGGFISILPLVLVVILMQRNLIRGLTFGAVK